MSTFPNLWDTEEIISAVAVGPLSFHMTNPRGTEVDDHVDIIGRPWIPMIQIQWLPSIECLLGPSHFVKDLPNITYFCFHRNSMGYMSLSSCYTWGKGRSQKRNNLSKFLCLARPSWGTKLGLPYILNSTLLVNNPSVVMFDFKSLTKPSRDPK